MPDVEAHSPVSRFEHAGQHFSGFEIDDTVRLATEAVRDDVSGPEQSQLFFEWPVLGTSHSEQQREPRLFRGDQTSPQNFSRVGIATRMVADVD